MGDVVTHTAMVVDVCSILVRCGEEMGRIDDDDFCTLIHATCLLYACCSAAGVMYERCVDLYSNAS